MSKRDVEFLQSVDIVSSLEQSELEVFRAFLDERKLVAGAAVFRQGDRDSDLYIVRNGTVRVLVNAPDGSEVEVARLGRGDFFGEMALFEDAPRSATCVMEDGGELLYLSRDEMFSLMSNQPEAAIKVMYKMANITAGRLQNTSSFLSDMVRWGEGARKRAITDDLTGLFNRRYLDDALAEQFAKARAKHTALALIMMDLDHFHVINDKWGQQVGDQVIAAVAPAVKESLRDGDLAARYGGDEFTLILPNTTAEDALAVAEGIRSTVQELQINLPGVDEIIAVTTSQGIAEFPRHGSDLVSLREQADQALYKAKEAGRNRAAIA